MTGAKDPKTVIARFARQDLVRTLMPGHRIKICNRYKIARNTQVCIHQPTQERGKPFYKGLMKCGSVWVCPVCSAKIVEKKTAELVQGTTGYLGGLAFGSITLQHTSRDPLSILLERLKISYRELVSGANWQRIKADFGIKGTYKTVELRWSKANGWHPHFHVLYFTEDYLGPSDIELMQERIVNIYLRKLASNGGYANRYIGIKFESVETQADKVAEYVAKWDHAPYGRPWSIETELTLSNYKRSQSLGYLDLIDLYSFHQEWAGDLILEYTLATAGKHMADWGPGTRKLLNLGRELSDQEIVDQETTDNRLLADLTDIWGFVLKNNLRGLLLDLADKDPVELDNQIANIKSLLGAMGTTQRDSYQKEVKYYVK